MCCHFNFCSQLRAVPLESVGRLGKEVDWQDSTEVELLGHWNNKKARKNILAEKKYRGGGEGERKTMAAPQVLQYSLTGMK